MSEQVEKQLVENISQLLKRSIVADSALLELRTDKKANFSAIFVQGSGFKSNANTFQPYIEEIADELLVWRKTNEQSLLINLVKKIEQLYKVMTEFESHYQQNDEKKL